MYDVANTEFVYDDIKLLENRFKSSLCTTQILDGLKPYRYKKFSIEGTLSTQIRRGLMSSETISGGILSRMSSAIKGSCGHYFHPPEGDSCLPFILVFLS